MAINFIGTQSLLTCSGRWSGTSFNLDARLEKNSLVKPSYKETVNQAHGASCFVPGAKENRRCYADDGRAFCFYPVSDL